jgi:pyrroloquinoline-quinone synthase
VDFWNSLERVRARNDVLRHPFYRRWTAGELTRRELALYAGQYRHAVVALARASAQAAEAIDADRHPALRAELDAHAAEESSHVALWDGFCAAVGGDCAASPTQETARCAASWAGDGARPFARSLVALYAVEAAQPAIASAKRAGLTRYYGVREGPATEYFELHEHRDVEHAAASRRLIAERLDVTGTDGAPAAQDVRAMLDEAEAVLASNWLLLDGVERLAGT